MDWFRNNHFIRSSPQPRALTCTNEECDETACYDSFKQHWNQTLKIIKRNQSLPNSDDVLGIVNHLEQIISLLLYDFKKPDQISLPIAATSQCLDYLISENILDQLFEWGIRAGKFSNAVCLEQMKLYEMLVSQSRHLLLVHEPFLQPLLKLLNSCKQKVFPPHFDKPLVNLLYQLCIVLTQNVDLVDLFFPRNTEKPKFIIFLLLIPFMHREDNIGMQARNSLLLCMSLSKKNANVKEFIEESQFDALLASGLSGLYSTLPHVLMDIAVPDWHQLTPDDVNDIKDLSTFITALEFSNNVSQMAHPRIVKQLQEFIYMGFLVPVFGPALLQNTTEEQIAVTAYLELMLRTVSNPGLLPPVIRYLLTIDYDGHRLLDILMKRINSPDAQLSLVSIALFETLIDVNCEDVMLELVFHHLQPCLHLMLSQRRMLFSLDRHCESAEKFLALAPNCCDNGSTSPTIDGRAINWNHYGSQTSLYGNYHAYLLDAKNKIQSCQTACLAWSHSYTGCESIGLESTDENSTSLPSIGESSGYESLKSKLEESSLPVWQQSQHDVKTNSIPTHVYMEGEGLGSNATAGPFLTILLDKVRDMLKNSFYINLHLTGLISRLAVYSQPLLRTYLLDHTLVLQPNVPSIFQIMGSLKQTVDEFMAKQPEKLMLIYQARTFLLEREKRLINARRSTVDSVSQNSTHTTNSSSEDSFQRNGPKRRSITQSLSSMFGRRHSSSETSIQMVTQSEEAKSFVHPKFNDAQRVALCAVLLEEWTKELAALAQEHAISQLAVLLK